MEIYTHDPTAPSAAFPYPDELLFPSHIWQAVKDPQVAIEPAWKVSLVYGIPCSVLCMFPAAYYLAARFQEDFEQAVLHAANGGGKNMPRAMLTNTSPSGDGTLGKDVPGGNSKGTHGDD